MTPDPLSLKDIRTPEILRLARAAPSPIVANIFQRLTNGNFADSLEVKVTLLAHLTYHIYRDLKETHTI